MMLPFSSETRSIDPGALGLKSHKCMTQIRMIGRRMVTLSCEDCCDCHEKYGACPYDLVKKRWVENGWRPEAFGHPHGAKRPRARSDRPRDQGVGRPRRDRNGRSKARKKTYAIATVVANPSDIRIAN